MHQVDQQSLESNSFLNEYAEIFKELGLLQDIEATITVQ